MDTPMNVCTCPQREQLQDYVLGKLDLPSHQTLDEHLDECTSCQELVESLDGSSDPMLDWLRQPIASPDLDDSRVPQLAARVQSLPAQLVRSDELPTLRNYQLLEPIGAGGMGRVFKAEHRHMKRLVAVKLLVPELLPSEAARSRFQREIEAV